MPPREDPAERTGYLRFFYWGWRPTRLGRFWSRAYAWVVGLGLTPGILLNLQIIGRIGGRLSSTTLVVARYHGGRYLVSMLGNDSGWVQNVRAAGGKAFIKRGQRQAILHTEIPAEERGPILEALCQIATSGRQHLPVSHWAPVSAFETIASDYPVFRIDLAVWPWRINIASNPSIWRTVQQRRCVSLPSDR
jgi:hypothetical protein